MSGKVREPKLKEIDSEKSLKNDSAMTSMTNEVVISLTVPLKTGSTSRG